MSQEEAGESVRAGLIPVAVVRQEQGADLRPRRPREDPAAVEELRPDRLGERLGFAPRRLGGTAGVDQVGPVGDVDHQGRQPALVQGPADVGDQPIPPRFVPPRGLLGLPPPSEGDALP